MLQQMVELMAALHHSRALTLQEVLSAEEESEISPEEDRRAALLHRDGFLVFGFYPPKHSSFTHALTKCKHLPTHKRSVNPECTHHEYHRCTRE